MAPLEEGFLSVQLRCCITLLVIGSSAQPGGRRVAEDDPDGRYSCIYGARARERRCGRWARWPDPRIALAACWTSGSSRSAAASLRCLLPVFRRPAARG